MSFPKSFLWGGASANAQFEGGYNEGGRGLSQLDFCVCVGTNKGTKEVSHELSYEQFLYNKAHQDEINFPFRKGVDFYHHYKEDIKLLADMGARAFRLSISWARIFPTGEEEEPNREGLDFYHKVFRELRAHHIEPLVTMAHYEVPVALVEKYNGWESPKLVELFTKYGKTLIDEFKDEVKYWITFNEINWATVTPYGAAGMFVERSKKNRLSAIHQAIHHQLVASAQVVSYCHETAPQCMISVMVGKFTLYPMTCNPADVENTYKEQRMVTYYFDVAVRGKYPAYALKYFKDYDIQIDFYPGYEEILAKDSIDFLSISYYATNVITADFDSAKEKDNLLHSPKNPYLKTGAWGALLDYKGIKISIESIYDLFQKPVFVVENGMAAFDEMDEEHTIHDEYRIDYHREIIKSLQEVIDDGVELLGYTTWGLIDVISASGGQICKRFGFIYVDADDEGNGSYKRYPKDSYYWYKKVIASDGADLE